MKTTNPNDALRLKSLVFWLDRIQKIDELNFNHRYWVRRDYEAYMRAEQGVCGWCKGSPVMNPVAGPNDEPVVINGVVVDRVQCYCLTLQLLSEKASRFYEAPYSDASLDEIEEYDEPKGAARDTKMLKKGLSKFMWNPTRSALIFGGTGAAKSHALRALKTYFGGFAAYITGNLFFDKLMYYTKSKDHENGVAMFTARLKHAPILLFDDFGLGHDAEYGINVLSSIIDYRYSLGRFAPTIMTTNKTMTEMMPVPGVVNNTDRLMSRMMDSDFSSIFPLSQGDFRVATFKQAVGIGKGGSK